MCPFVGLSRIPRLTTFQHWIPITAAAATYISNRWPRGCLQIQSSPFARYFLQIFTATPTRTGDMQVTYHIALYVRVCLRVSLIVSSRQLLPKLAATFYATLRRHLSIHRSWYPTLTKYLQNKVESTARTKMEHSAPNSLTNLGRICSQIHGGTWAYWVRGFFYQTSRRNIRVVRSSWYLPNFTAARRPRG